MQTPADPRDPPETIANAAANVLRSRAGVRKAPMRARPGCGCGDARPRGRPAGLNRLAPCPRFLFRRSDERLVMLLREFSSRSLARRGLRHPRRCPAVVPETETDDREHRK